MRILPIAYIGAFICCWSIAAANEEYIAPLPDSSNGSVAFEKQYSLENSDEVMEVDPLVTGATVTKKHLLEWEARRDLYFQCPECFANQPYPED
ncbi:MAG: hypothetical protein AAF478_12160 [Pseudomonadota bacterium]